MTIDWASFAAGAVTVLALLTSGLAMAAALLAHGLDKDGELEVGGGD